MRAFRIPGGRMSFVTGLAYAAIAVLLLPTPSTAIAQDKMVTEETLLDRIWIEDLLARYYVDLTTGTGHVLSEYYTEDAVLDVNGTIATGHEEIAAMYGGDGEDAEEGADDARDGQSPQVRAHMLLTNPVISVEGDEATAWVVWTGLMNDDIKEPPRLFEQGREYTELVKRDGRWLIRHRYISADSGMPDRWDATYEPRSHR